MPVSDVADVVVGTAWWAARLSGRVATAGTRVAAPVVSVVIRPPGVPRNLQPAHGADSDGPAVAARSAGDHPFPRGLVLGSVRRARWTVPCASVDLERLLAAVLDAVDLDRVVADVVRRLDVDALVGLVLERMDVDKVVATALDRWTSPSWSCSGSISSGW